MKRKIILIAIALAGFLMHDAFAEASRQSTAALARAKSVKPAPQRGTLYRVRHQGNTSYLFGTIHVGKAAFYPLGSEVTQALAKASKLGVELDTRNVDAVQSAMQKQGMYGIGDSLQNHLSPDLLAQLKQALATAKIPFESILQMKPWLVANILLQVDLASSGYDREQGIEDYLLKAATLQKKQVIELESADYQFSLFNKLTEQQQQQFLREALTEIKDGKARKDTAQLANAWGNGDARELARLIDQSLNEKSVGSAFTQQVLLDQRNPAMANKIEGLLQHDRVTFVGVGLLHLVGEKSVPALLRQRGYVVDKLY